jgi:glutamyl/glutaminyl-tRNA synthetase
MAQERARSQGGDLIFRNEDLDDDRCRPEFVAAMFDDLKWFGLAWQEGPDMGGPFAPYNQSERMDRYRDAFEKLRALRLVYPCSCSRKDIQMAVTAPHAADDEVIYPGTCRAKMDEPGAVSANTRLAWRFRVSDGETISFGDGRLGGQSFMAGKDFGDFVVWRGDGKPSYQLACVVDDAAMQISEVVRGEDLLVSTARQLLLYRALSLAPPGFFHCELLRDESGQRLAKRHDALSLRRLRARGERPVDLRVDWAAKISIS